MQITYVGPFPAVEIVDQGQTLVVAAGVTVSVSDELAGRAPDPRLVAAHLEHRAAVEALDHNGARALEAEIVGLDHGCGLLAQPSNWQAVAAAKTSKTKDGE